MPKILYYFDHRLISTHAGRFDWRLGLFRETYGGKPDGPATSVRRDGLDTASFCCALVPAQAFRDAGTLDERFFMYYEETDFIRRAQAAGYRVRYEPSSVIYHRESGASGGGWMTPFKQYYATRNRLYLVRKHARSRPAYAYFTAYFWATRACHRGIDGRTRRAAAAAGDGARRARLLSRAHGEDDAGEGPVRIAIDATSMPPQPAGAAVYAIELVSALAARDRHDGYALFVRGSCAR